MLFRRRGAHFTFDGEAYAAFVRRLDEPEVQFPSFSHRDKDPVAEGGWIRPHHRIV
jgi:pantothenate kinase